MKARDNISINTSKTFYQLGGSTKDQLDFPCNCFIYLIYFNT